uniref:Major facilitator superfamily (MFS) profile domain-containing protein n=1 Tax=Chromera velia CCMP2878 TaxID=1169474 RepID=A0A0G4F1F7_9ALVE|eukprot:Cvel_2634.t1-p1 / transcript=Cvel_2634.t1 / gene=Cvel_2634 / organism=Chromera_velia_CCMP2878 / gene_product=Putative glycerol-3-phosphate transporter 3, putative / transcript_product=Putative glycerol-3-phosphate transporter 3, putative / location=Cvel_scaffold104:74979-76334(-) / protein_length=452 / sequence_SO=supercontig / SO=protein_coding / is_pseudo=false
MAPQKSMYRWVVFALTYVTYASIYFTRKPFSVVKAAMETDLRISKQSLGAVDTGFLSAYAVGQFLIGPIGDRFGARPTLVLSFLGSAVTTLFFGMSANLTFLVALWSLNGLTQAGCFPMMVKALNPWFDASERGSVMGLWTTCQQVGGAGSTAIAAFLLSRFGWRSAFFWPAVWVLACSVALLLGLPDAGPSTGGEEAAKKGGGVGETKKKEKEKAAPASFGETLKIPGLMALGFGYFCVKLVRYTLMFWLPYYLSKVLEYDAATAGLMSTLFDIGGALGSVVCGIVADRLFDGKKIIVVAPMCALTGILSAMYGPASRGGVHLNMGVMFLVGFMVAGPDSVLGGAATTDVCERNKMNQAVGTACGLVNGMGSLGAILQGFLTAWIADVYGWTGLFQSLAALGFIAVTVLAPLALEDFKSVFGKGKRRRKGPDSRSTGEPRRSNRLKAQKGE